MMPRLLLWLVAAVALGGISFAGAEFAQRSAGLASAGCVCVYEVPRSDHAVAGHGVIAEEHRLPLPGLVVPEPFFDGDSGGRASEFIAWGRTPGSDFIGGSQQPDGQPSTAFNSRAPPVLA